jgi:hypothetical protein
MIFARFLIFLLSLAAAAGVGLTAALSLGCNGWDIGALGALGALIGTEAIYDLLAETVSKMIRKMIKSIRGLYYTRQAPPPPAPARAAPISPWLPVVYSPIGDVGDDEPLYGGRHATRMVMAGIRAEAPAAQRLPGEHRVSEEFRTLLAGHAQACEETAARLYQEADEDEFPERARVYRDKAARIEKRGRDYQTVLLLTADLDGADIDCGAMAPLDV